MKLRIAFIFIIISSFAKAQLYTGISCAFLSDKLEFVPINNNGSAEALENTMGVIVNLEYKTKNSFNLESDITFLHTLAEIRSGYNYPPDYYIETDTFTLNQFEISLVPLFETGEKFKLKMGAGPAVKYLYNAYVDGYSEWSGWTGGGEFNPGSEYYHRGANNYFSDFGVGFLLVLEVNYQLFDKIIIFSSFKKYKQINTFTAESNYGFKINTNKILFGLKYRLTN